MQAWQVQGKGEPADVLRQVQIDVPEPGADQLRVRVTAAGIGLPDVLMCRGTYPLTPPLPFTPGQEVVGVVTAAGAQADVAVGSSVMGVTAFYLGSGSFAEECLVPAGSAFAVPDGLTDAQAAGFWIPHMTAWVGLVDRGRLATEEWIAVLGAAGGSGIAAVQLGRALGGRVIAVVSDEQKAAFCNELGADVVLATSSLDGRLADAVREITAGHGVDIIYDPVGGALAEDAAGALARGGRLLCVGFASGRWPQPDTHQLVLANAELVGVFAGGYSREALLRMHGHLAGLISDGRLRNAVTDTVGFAELPGAVQRIADRKVIGKLVMTV